MEIISLHFAIFVMVTLAVFFLMPGRWQNLILLLASYYFYSTWSWKYVTILILLTLFNFYYAQILFKFNQYKRPLLWTGIGVNSAIFLLFLFGDFFGPLIAGLVEGWRNSSIVTAFLLPIGFSYYVLECIGYLVDIQLKISKPSGNLIDFALFLTYFPKLISGPIERARNFIPQISEKKVIGDEQLSRSLILILVGLFRSVALGGLITLLVPASVIISPQKYSAMEIIWGVLVQLFYLYNQFAGYTDIVRGVSGLFGIQLTRNFAYPFFAKDFSDFWKRWHISLSQWLRDYIYMPLSRSFLRRNPSRSNKANLLIPPVVTMLVSGLWHGGSPGLILWGAINGGYIVMENVLNVSRPTLPGAQKPGWQRMLSGVTVSTLLAFSTVPFFLDLSGSKIFLYRLFFEWKWIIPDLRPIIVIGLSLLLDWIQSRHSDESDFLGRQGWPRALSAALIIFAIVIVYNLQGAPSTFVYP